MVFLSNELWFPDPGESTDDGLIAIGGDMSPERLLLAYRNGIFPWFRKEGYPFWFCPEERMVLFPNELHVSRSMKKVMRSGRFQVTEDRAFEEVIRACAEVHEQIDFDTWIDDEFIRAYTQLHHLGYAHSIEVWEEEKLVGGMYGISIGKIFCGESMFSRASNTSKMALIHVCESKRYTLIDCQVPTPHLASMGARLVSRDAFLKMIKMYGQST